MEPILNLPEKKTVSTYKTVSKPATKHTDPLPEVLPINTEENYQFNPKILMNFLFETKELPENEKKSRLIYAMDDFFIKHPHQTNTEVLSRFIAPDPNRRYPQEVFMRIIGKDISRGREIFSSLFSAFPNIEKWKEDKRERLEDLLWQIRYGKNVQIRDNLKEIIFQDFLTTGAGEYKKRQKAKSFIKSDFPEYPSRPEYVRKQKLFLWLDFANEEDSRYGLTMIKDFLKYYPDGFSFTWAVREKILSLNKIASPKVKDFLKKTLVLREIFYPGQGDWADAAVYLLQEAENERKDYISKKETIELPSLYK